MVKEQNESEFWLLATLLNTGIMMIGVGPGSATPIAHIFSNNARPEFKPDETNTL